MFKKKFIIIVCIFLFNILFLTNFVSADSQMTHFIQTSGFGESASVGSVIAIVIKAFLSLLSLIFIVLILYAGFNWMTAGGDEKKVEDAKGTIQRAVIGLVIIIAAYSITYFVFSILPFGSGNGSSVGGSSGLPVEGSSLWGSVRSWWGDMTGSSIGGI